MDGLHDIHASSEAAVAAGSELTPLLNEAITVSEVEGPVAALPLAQRFTELSRERGWVYGELWGVGTLLDLFASSGRWDEALHVAAEAETLMEGHGDVCDLGQTRAFHALVRIWRGESDLAMPLAEWSLEKARELEEPPHLATALIASAAARMPHEPLVARVLLEELSCRTPSAFRGSTNWRKCCGPREASPTRNSPSG